MALGQWACPWGYHKLRGEVRAPPFALHGVRGSHREPQGEPARDLQKGALVTAQRLGASREGPGRGNWGLGKVSAISNGTARFGSNSHPPPWTLETQLLNVISPPP